MLKKSIIIALAALAVGGVAVAQQMAPPPGAQTAGLKRTVLQKFDVPAGDRETVTAFIEIPANTDVARHTHPGPEVDYVVEGDLVLNIDGQPPKPYKAGDSFSIPQGVVHGGRSGPNGTKLVGTYIVEKGKPLASPAP
jgi:quercetin dioxygenase-like cupin family protein